MRTLIVIGGGMRVPSRLSSREEPNPVTGGEHHLGVCCTNPAVRLATWNCRSGFHRGWDVVPSLGANVLSLQEFGPETKAEVESMEGWSCEWQKGRYDVKGIAVLAHCPFEIV